MGTKESEVRVGVTPCEARLNKLEALTVVLALTLLVMPPSSPMSTPLL